MSHRRRQVLLLLSAFVLFVVIFAFPAHAQESSKTLTLHLSSNLTLVDVTVSDRRAGLLTQEPLTDLKREDFRVFDDGHEMPIDSFDIGAQHTTRPIALWLIVQCNDSQPAGHHSMFLHGKTKLLEPALKSLAADDLVGVAHWCDNGDALLDLAAGHDTNAAIATVEDVLNKKPITGTQTRNGELAMQRMIRLVLKATNERVTHLEPIFLFLYGDRCGTHVEEAESILKDLLESSAIVYGLNDGTWYAVVRSDQSTTPSIGLDAEPPGAPSATRPEMTYHLVHYYSHETGGMVYSTLNPTHLSDALNTLLTQLQLRYTIGFRPLNLDGKRHHLKVELTPSARKRFKSAEFHFRLDYIPVAKPMF
jgi:hypothetical protein